MDTFEGQYNDIPKNLCSKNRCEIAIIPCNLIQPLNLTVDKVAKVLIQNKYNDWFSNQAAHQLKSGKEPVNINI